MFYLKLLCILRLLNLIKCFDYRFRYVIAVEALALNSNKRFTCSPIHLTLQIVVQMIPFSNIISILDRKLFIFLILIALSRWRPFDTNCKYCVHPRTKICHFGSYIFVF